MNLRTPFVALSTAILFAACSTDAVLAPKKAPGSVNLSMNAGSSAGSYIVSLRANSSGGFRDQVTALGGSVTYLNAKVGFATVSGISSAAAAKLGAIAGVSEVQADVAVSLESPARTAPEDAVALANPSIQSQGNPAGAILFSRQWDMRAIKAPVAWANGRTGSSNVTVAILDTGIDYNSLDSNGLVDLSRSTSFAQAYVPVPADSLLTDDQMAARGDSIVHANFFPARAVYTDFNGHGTNVASVVSSVGFAFAGVTSRTTLMAVKVLGSNGAGSLGSILAGIAYAADNGADVANMSLGGAFSKAGNGRFVGLINKVFNYAKQQGMLIVVSAGNSNIDIQHNGNQYVDYCDASHVVCVSSVGPAIATGNVDTPAFYTSFGKSMISVAAPGGNGVLDATGHLVPTAGWPWGVSQASWVYGMCAKDALAGFTDDNVPVKLGCQSGGAFIGFIGTSQAAPHVTGLAALLVAEYGKGNPTFIKHRIEQTGDAMNPAFGGAFGNTRINVQRALGLPTI